MSRTKRDSWKGKAGFYRRGHWWIVRTARVMYNGRVIAKGGEWAANRKRDMGLTPAPIVAPTLREAKWRVNRRYFGGRA